MASMVLDLWKITTILLHLQNWVIMRRQLLTLEERRPSLSMPDICMPAPYLRMTLPCAGEVAQMDSLVLGPTPAPPVLPSPLPSQVEVLLSP